MTPMYRYTVQLNSGWSTVMELDSICHLFQGELSRSFFKDIEIGKQVMMNLDWRGIFPHPIEYTFERLS